MRDLKGKIESLREDFDDAAEQIHDLDTLHEIRNVYVSRKKGHLTRLIAELKNLTAEDRKEAGRLINSLKNHIQDGLRLKEDLLGRKADKKSNVDLTLPGSVPYWGAPHPLVQVLNKVVDIFLKIGFSTQTGPEIETDYYNFTALNYPEHHPSRSESNTFYIDDTHLLRTHTASVYIRMMEKHKPPLRIIAPGKIYRNQSPGNLSYPVLFQVEGLVVDTHIDFSHLKGLLDVFLRQLFSDRIKLRYRPSFFPFTETSVKIDMNCPCCTGGDADCHACQGKGWTEIMAAGMIGPQVFKNVNINPEIYSGFAFGLEVDRLAGLLYDIPAPSSLYENDIRLIRTLSRKS